MTEIKITRRYIIVYCHDCKVMRFLEIPAREKDNDCPICHKNTETEIIDLKGED